ncbi:MAG TPA: gamma-glutamyltransferase [Chloroflexota bacterium]|nr:gamma-glutamyltransferase [Chloroflexota bacterium]
MVGVTRVMTRLRREKDEVAARDGMVVAKHPLAALAGLEVLERGGNAVDAAVTTAFAAGVTLPFSNGLGGGGYLLFHDAATARTHVVDYAMQAPAAAHEGMYQPEPDGRVGGSFGWRLMQGHANWHGWTSMAVPGTVAGLALALERFGTISLADALVPAIRLAEEGFPLSPGLAASINNQWELIGRTPSSRDILAAGGRPRAVGERLRQPQLARTLRRLAEAGAADFYRGQIAHEIAADMREHGGLVSEDDLAAYRPRTPEGPLVGHYRGATLHAAPGATGATSMLQILGILAGYDLGGLGAGSAESLHLWIEASRLAFADRFQYLADPQHVDVPWRGLLAPAYAAERRRAIDPARAAGHYPAGDPWPHEGRPRPAVTHLPSRPWDSGGTTHLSVVDRARNAVALTQTLLSWSGVVLPRTGVVMNDAMGWFDPLPGRANSVAPAKRGLNNMSPVILLADGKPWLTLGAPGGRRIIGTVAQVISNLLDHGMGVQAAISAPKLDCSEPVTKLDARIPEAVRAALHARGHRLAVTESTPGASPSAVLIDHASGRLLGGEDPFSEGVAAGYSSA